RELRPYMYWLGFLSTGRQAGELDWQAIGGTWGVATSRLADWTPRGDFVPTGMRRALLAIPCRQARNRPPPGHYLHKYFEDMFVQLAAMLPLLRPGAAVHYIVGNSIFYGQLVSAEQFLAQQMAAIGLRGVQITPLRKRNSKRGLLEFQVTGRRGT